MIPLAYSVRSLLRRPLTATVTIVGLSLVVFVFAAVLMLSAGVRETLALNGSPENAIALRDGATSVASSVISRDQVRLLSAEPEVAVGSDGRPLLAGEVSVIGNLPRIDGKGGANVGMRGTTEESLLVRSSIKVIRGRLPRPGTLEVMVGKAIEGRYLGSRIGESLSFARREWPVVGVFEAGGSAFESEMWGGAQELMDAFDRQAFSDAIFRLKDPAALATLTGKLAADPQLSTVKVMREDRFYESQSEGLRTFVVALGTFVAVIFAIAAALGAAVTMYAQVAGRVREVGTLRAIGFKRRTVLAVFLREAILLSLLAGVIGTAAASALSLVTFSALNNQSFTQITFHFSFSVGVAVAALIFSLVMGLLGGFSPAIGAARLSIVSAARGGR
jgi:ABC-type antimicrobial peptide transport system permease subunit